MLRNNLPNFVTCLNLFCGCVALVFCSEGSLLSASAMVLLAMVFDFFDGMLARLLRSSSSIGKDLDSLADVVSFGVVPSMLLHEAVNRALEFNTGTLSAFTGVMLSWLPFIFALGAAWRLAVFNNDPEQSTSFKGLPTPAAALAVPVPRVGRASG